eukprot:10465699-Alexandrium_andersonii.AAC.1
MMRFSNFHFLQVRRASADAPFKFSHELLAHQPLRDVQVNIVAREGEVAPAHDAPRVQLAVVEATRTGPALGKPEALE